MSARKLPPQLAFTLALREPALALSWTIAEWEQTIRTARRLRLLARLAAGLDAGGLSSQVNALPRNHLRAELQLSRWRLQSMQWAMECVDRTLDGTGYPRVLLKGAAYLAQDLPIGSGRLPADLDIMVPKAHLLDAMDRLKRDGWQDLELDEHDRRYYFEWSHEVPPMRHPIHTMELDLHHNILPPLARTHVDAGLLLARLRPSLQPGWSVLHPVDQVLHSASHLFLDSEPRERVRDIVDLDGLMRHFGVNEPGFWDELPRRGAVLGLGEPLALALHFVVRWYGTPVPAAALDIAKKGGPGWARRAWLHPLWERLLTPGDPDRCTPWMQQVAAQMVLARYHAQRLPWRLLIPHLWRKFKSRRALADLQGLTAEKR